MILVGVRERGAHFGAAGLVILHRHISPRPIPAVKQNGKQQYTDLHTYILLRVKKRHLTSYAKMTR